MYYIVCLHSACPQVSEAVLKTRHYVVISAKEKTKCKFIVQLKPFAKVVY